MVKSAGVLAAFFLAASLAVTSVAQTPPPAYRVPPPISPAPPTDGWSLSASLRGRTLDLGDADWNWADDPRVTTGERSFGYGWRDDRSSLLLGYRQPGEDGAAARLGARLGSANAVQPRPALLGFTWTYRPPR